MPRSRKKVQGPRIPRSPQWLEYVIKNCIDTYGAKWSENKIRAVCNLIYRKYRNKCKQEGVEPPEFVIAAQVEGLTARVFSWLESKGQVNIYKHAQRFKFSLEIDESYFNPHSRFRESEGVSVGLRRYLLGCIAGLGLPIAQTKKSERYVFPIKVKGETQGTYPLHCAFKVKVTTELEYFESRVSSEQQFSETDYAFMYACDIGKKVDSVRNRSLLYTRHDDVMSFVPFYGVTKTTLSEWWLERGSVCENRSVSDIRDLAKDTNGDLQKLFSDAIKIVQNDASSNTIMLWLGFVIVGVTISYCIWGRCRRGAQLQEGRVNRDGDRARGAADADHSEGEDEVIAAAGADHSGGDGEAEAVAGGNEVMGVDDDHQGEAPPPFGADHRGRRAMGVVSMRPPDYDSAWRGAGAPAGDVEAGGGAAASAEAERAPLVAAGAGGGYGAVGDDAVEVGGGEGSPGSDSDYDRDALLGGGAAAGDGGERVGWLISLRRGWRVRSAAAGDDARPLARELRLSADF